VRRSREGAGRGGVKTRTLENRKNAAPVKVVCE
jgi:hypothetical protein